MKRKIQGTVVAFCAIALTACQEDPTLSAPDHLATLHAVVGSQAEITTKADQDEAGTCSCFTSDDVLGLYTTATDGGADSPLLTNEEPMKKVENLKFTYTNEKWETGTPKLKWNTTGNRAADIYGYFPWQANPAAYTIFRGDRSQGVLEDVLVAERTTVENNNPAIFLTFKHRFALLRLQLGTGLEGASDDIAVVMNKGIDDTAAVDLGAVKLKLNDDENKKLFRRINTKTDYYNIIVPVEAIKDKNPTDSLQVTGVMIGSDLSDFNSAFTPKANTVYYLTIHKGEQGSVFFTMSGIEEWGSERHQGSVRLEGGIYWYSDMIGLANLLNSMEHTPTAADKKLETYGKWDEENEIWVFPLMRDIDMTEGSNRSCPIKSFTGILEGNGRTINGLDITGNGLFEKVEAGSEIRNLTLTDASVNSSSGNAGILAGEVAEGVKIHNCVVDGKSAVNGNGKNVGGLIGKGAAEITRSSAQVDVTNSGGACTGGLIGSLETGGSIDDCYTLGRVTSTGDQVGGLAGQAAGEITNSHAACKVKGKDQVGGLVGSTTAPLSNCYSSGTTEGTQSVGGLAGVSSASITRCASDGSVTGSSAVGGLVGTHNADAEKLVTINGCSSRATVTGSSSVGGLIGAGTAYSVKNKDPEDPEDPENPEEPVEPVIEWEQGSCLVDCYATNKKGLIGNSGGTISHCYEIGSDPSDETTHYYRIALPPSASDVEAIIAALNSDPTNPEASSRNRWVKGTVIIEGQSYVLPVLN